MASQTLNVTRGLHVTLEALPGKASEVESFLRQGQALVEQEPGTIAWFAVRLGPTTFGIFDVFADDDGRQAHLSGEVAKALGENTGTLFEAPTIAPLDVIASKLPG
jgi:quinol monooxygenase YgiN